MQVGKQASKHAKSLLSRRLVALPARHYAYLTCNERVMRSADGHIHRAFKRRTERSVYDLVHAEQEEYIYKRFFFFNNRCELRTK